jgi:hypothetical protein
VQRAIQQAIKQIRDAGKAAGFLAVDPLMAKKVLEWGLTSWRLVWTPCFIPARWINVWRYLKGNAFGIMKGSY